MPNHDTLPNPKKFFFDRNDFDENRPPEPVFTGGDLDLARRDAFEQGRKAGLAEAKAQREKYVADLLAAVKNDFASLFAAETKRAAQYEAETLFLCRALFDRLFPGLNERHGLDEVFRTIVSVLEGQRTQPEIVVEVHPDYAPDVRAHITQSLKSAHEGICTVVGNPDLVAGDCRLRWENGGAARSATELCRQIGEIFDQTLADRPLLRDNREIKVETQESGDGG